MSISSSNEARQREGGGLAGLSGSEAYMIRAAEIATRFPSKVPALVRMAYDMELEAAPAIAEQLRAIVTV